MSAECSTQCKKVRLKYFDYQLLQVDKALGRADTQAAIGWELVHAYLGTSVLADTIWTLQVLSAKSALGV
ncbi:MAG: hypothetical protein MKZ95_04245 [Pirellulales bacterium]|nr:hypothetical protein [Pirellulales bacterium]